MKIYLNEFVSNSPGHSIYEYIQNIQVGTPTDYVYNVRFATSDKYMVVDTYYLFTPHYKGYAISIEPIIYDKNDAVCINEEDYDSYLEHPDYYRIVLVLDTGAHTLSSIVTPLKHEYIVSFINNDIIFDSALSDACIAQTDEAQ